MNKTLLLITLLIGVALCDSTQLKEAAKKSGGSVADAYKLVKEANKLFSEFYTTALEDLTAIASDDKAKNSETMFKAFKTEADEMVKARDKVLSLVQEKVNDAADLIEKNAKNLKKSVGKAADEVVKVGEDAAGEMRDAFITSASKFVKFVTRIEDMTIELGDTYKKMTVAQFKNETLGMITDKLSEKTIKYPMLKDGIRAVAKENTKAFESIVLMLSKEDGVDEVDELDGYDDGDLENAKKAKKDKTKSDSSVLSSETTFSSVFTTISDAVDTLSTGLDEAYKLAKQSEKLVTSMILSVHENVAKYAATTKYDNGSDLYAKLKEKVKPIIAEEETVYNNARKLAKAAKKALTTITESAGQHVQASDKKILSTTTFALLAGNEIVEACEYEIGKATKVMMATKAMLAEAKENKNSVENLQKMLEEYLAATSEKVQKYTTLDKGTKKTAKEGTNNVAKVVAEMMEKSAAKAGLTESSFNKVSGKTPDKSSSKADKSSSKAKPADDDDDDDEVPDEADEADDDDDTKEAQTSDWKDPNKVKKNDIEPQTADWKDPNKVKKNQNEAQNANFKSRYFEEFFK